MIAVLPPRKLPLPMPARNGLGAFGPECPMERIYTAACRGCPPSATHVSSRGYEMERVLRLAQSWPADLLRYRAIGSRRPIIDLVQHLDHPIPLVGVQSPPVDLVDEIVEEVVVASLMAGDPNPRGRAGIISVAEECLAQPGASTGWCKGR